MKEIKILEMDQGHEADIVFNDLIICPTGMIEPFFPWFYGERYGANE